MKLKIVVCFVNTCNQNFEQPENEAVQVDFSSTCPQGSWGGKVHVKPCTCILKVNQTWWYDN